MLRLVQVTNEEYDVWLDEQSASLNDAIRVIKRYEEVVRAQEKKVIRLLFKQECILKFENWKTETIGMIRSTIHVNFNPDKFVKKYMHLKLSTLSAQLAKKHQWIYVIFITQ